MNTKPINYYIGISILFLIGGLHSYLYDNFDKYDVFLFFEYKRYLSTIVYDVYGMTVFSMFSFWLIKLNKAVFTPLFIISLITWVLYFLFFNQHSELIVTPVYIILLIYYNWKYEKAF